MNSENILVCPSFKGSKVDVHKTITEKGTRYNIVYWKVLEKIHINGYYTDEEFEKIKKQCLIDNNKNTDILKLRNLILIKQL